MDGSGLIGLDHEPAFLNEFRIVVVTHSISPDPPELFVFNTLVPQDHPRSLQQFNLPPKYHNWYANIHLDHDRSLGTLNNDGPLMVDSTQAIVLVDMVSDLGEPEVFLIVQTQFLIEHVCSVGTDVQIPCQEIQNISPSFTLFNHFVLLTLFIGYDFPSNTLMIQENSHLTRLQQDKLMIHCARTSPIIQCTASSTRCPCKVPCPCPDPTTSLRLSRTPCSPHSRSGPEHLPLEGVYPTHAVRSDLEPKARHIPNVGSKCLLPQVAVEDLQDAGQELTTSYLPRKPPSSQQATLH
jgi:hypothetical protein